MSEVSIVNTALTLLGESRILNLNDNVKPAREASAIYAITRDSLMAAHNWSFTFERVALNALVDPPLYDYAYAYQLPSDCLRVVMVSDIYVGVDLSNYRSQPVSLYSIEGRKILSNLGAPLNIKYCKRITDTSLFNPNFEMTFAAKLASLLAEPLTQSNTKREKAEDEFRRQLSMAVRANAIELSPSKLPDDEWIMSRL